MQIPGSHKQSFWPLGLGRSLLPGVCILTNPLVSPRQEVCKDPRKDPAFRSPALAKIWKTDLRRSPVQLSFSNLHVAAARSRLAAGSSWGPPHSFTSSLGSWKEALR